MFQLTCCAFCFQGLDLDEKLKLVSQMGFGTVDLSGKQEMSRKLNNEGAKTPRESKKVRTVNTKARRLEERPGREPECTKTLRKV